MSKIRLLAGDKQSGETSKAIQACNDYFRMGPGRSLADLSRNYAELDQNQPPTRSLGTLKSWSAKYKWEGRCIEYDARIEAEKTARAEEIMNSGLALVHNRTEELIKLYDLLNGELLEKDPKTGVLHNLWVPDVKSLGGGEYVDIEHFNAALIRELRATLDDIASEVGGRTKHIQAQTLNINLDAMSDEQLKRLAAGEDLATVLATSEEE
jgi:hypothetical protein